MDPVSGFSSADPLGLRRASRPPSLPLAELPACAFCPSSSLPLAELPACAFCSSSGLPLAEPPACAGCSSSGSSGGQASGFRLSLVPSGPSGHPGSPDSRRLPWFPASRGWHSRLSSGAPSSGLVPSTDFRPQSSTHPLILLPVSFRLSPSSGFVGSFSDSFPTYCSFISWTDIMDRSPVHASANQVFCVDSESASLACRKERFCVDGWIHLAAKSAPEEVKKSVSNRIRRTTVTRTNYELERQWMTIVGCCTPPCE